MATGGGEMKGSKEYIDEIREEVGEAWNRLGVSPPVNVDPIQVGTRRLLNGMMFALGLYRREGWVNDEDAEELVAEINGQIVGARVAWICSNKEEDVWTYELIDGVK